MGELYGSLAGIGLKPCHYDAVLVSRPAVDFFEIHAENYMMEGGPHRRYLDGIADLYSLSLHGVGLSLGSADGIDAGHLARFRALVDACRPALVSEHLAWSVADGSYFADLLPLPLTAETLDVVSGNIRRVQDALGRRILVENPSLYLAFDLPQMPEPDFLAALAARTGCGLLLDINNVAVSAANLGFAAEDYLARIDPSLVGEIHLAGHLAKSVDGHDILIDDHGSPVSEPVWALYEAFIRSAGPVPTLIERDNNIPSLPELVAEAERAKSVLARESVDA